MTVVVASDQTSGEHRKGRIYVAPTDRLITVPFVMVTATALAFFMYIGTLLPLIPLYIESDVIGGDE
jgi:biotin-(acetyl-CoA carboxylase) ligase